MGVRSRWNPVTGEWSTVERAPSQPRVYIQGDRLPTPLQHPVDGKFYDSKSQFRALTKAAGYIERGTDRLPPHEYQPRSEIETIAKAKQMVEQGYRPGPGTNADPELTRSMVESTQIEEPK